MSIFDSGEEPEENEEDNNERNQPPETEDTMKSNVVDDIEEQVKSLDSQLDSLEQRAEELEQHSEVHDSDIEEIREEVQSLEDDIGELLGIYDLVASRINPLVSQDIDSLVHDLNSDVDRDVQDFYDLKDSDGKFEEVDIEEIAEEIQKEIGEIERHSKEEIKRELKEELREEVKKDLKNELSGQDEPDEHPRTEPTTEEDQEGKYKSKVEKIDSELSQEVVAMKWIDTIVEEYDSKTLVNALNYYSEVGWVSNKARRQLIRRFQMADFSSKEQSDVENNKIPEKVHEMSSKYLNQLSR